MPNPDHHNDTDEVTMRVFDSSFQIIRAQTPSHFRATYDGGTVSLTASPLQVNARCKVEADTSFVPTNTALVSRDNPRLAPWKLGFMQVQILENAWAYYRGVQSADGCALNDHSAFRQPQICRDYDRSRGSVWYEGSDNIHDCYGLPDYSRPSPWQLEFYFGDRPKQDFHERILNSTTNRYNHLHEARCAIAFVTTVSEQVSRGVFKHHRHFFWSAIWHLQSISAHPQTKNDTFRILPGSGFWMSDIRRGAPHDTRYLSALNNASLTQSCNEITQSVSVKVQRASSWQRFPEMDRKDKLF